MGVLIEVLYRTEYFNFHSASSAHHGIKLPSLQQIITFVTLCALLVVSGVELNPGPNLSCKTCEKDFNNLIKFYHHLKVHSSLKNVTLHCPFAGCCLHYSTIRSLESHVSRDHKHDKPVFKAVTVNFKCPVPSCGTSISNRKEYLAHMPIHLREGLKFQCGYPDCYSSISTLASFRTHVSCNHPTKEPVAFEDNVGMLSSSSSESEDNTTNNADVINHGNKNYNKVGSKSDKVLDNTDEGKGDSSLREYHAKDELAKFYLKLEGVHFLPTSTVQVISKEVSLVTELSHAFLKKSLKPQLQSAGLDENVINGIMQTTFKSDPVYNIHHKYEDTEHLGTDFLRQKFWKKNYPYLTPKPQYLGKDERGKKKWAYLVSIRDSLDVLLKDPKIKKMVLDSFQKKRDPNILTDFTDGSAFKEHSKQHNGGRCLQILGFADSYDYNAFGPSIGAYKPMGFYYTLGNIDAEYRSKVDLIQMFYLILEKYLQPTEKEELADLHKVKEVLKPVLDEFKDLKMNGYDLDGENIPVCLFLQEGDNLGQHLIGGFIGSFSAEHCCRFCPSTMSEFRENPCVLKPMRTPEQYDRHVRKAKEKWLALRQTSLNYATRVKARRCANNSGQLLARMKAPGSKMAAKRLLSKSAFQKLRGVHYKGIKYRPSPLNSKTLKFHVCSPALPPCLAHDIFEGIAKKMVPAILKNLSEEKKWFDLPTLNKNIKSFRPEGSDKRDAPTPLKSFDSLGGNAVENWNLIRLLPLIIGNLIQDEEDEMWQLFLLFKVIVEYVCAPRISVSQVLYLKTLIAEFLSKVKILLPQCLIPKMHLLMHYPDLIMIFGPLIRVFTLRKESKHVFFKNVAESCGNFINFLYTLAKRYVCRFAYDHSSGQILPQDVMFEHSHSSPVFLSDIPEERKAKIPVEFLSKELKCLTSVSVRGIEYKVGYYMILDALEVCNLKVGQIDMIFIEMSSGKISFLLEEKPAVNSFRGYYRIQLPASNFAFYALTDLVDFYPLPSYYAGGHSCITLKHSNVRM